MKGIDLKHLVYHVLIGLYFVWLALFGVLQYFACTTALADKNSALAGIVLLWLLLNLVLGTTLFLVLRLFNKNNRLQRLVQYSYYTGMMICVPLSGWWYATCNKHYSRKTGVLCGCSNLIKYNLK